MVAAPGAGATGLWLSAHRAHGALVGQWLRSSAAAAGRTAGRRDAVSAEEEAVHLRHHRRLAWPSGPLSLLTVSSHEIARHLRIKQTTVQNHLSKILATLRIDRTGAIRLAEEAGLDQS